MHMSFSVEANDIVDCELEHGVLEYSEASSKFDCKSAEYCPSSLDNHDYSGGGSKDETSSEDDYTEPSCRSSEYSNSEARSKDENNGEKSKPGNDLEDLYSSFKFEDYVDSRLYITFANRAMFTCAPWS